MAHFYATLDGNRGQATRMGSKASGIRTSTASWSGQVRTYLWNDAKTGVDMAEVRLETWHGQGTERLLYRGPVSGKLD